MKTSILVLVLIMGINPFHQTNTDNKYFKSTITSDAPAEKVWATITDASKWKHWNTDIVDARLKGTLKKGDIGSMITANGDVLQYSIVSVEDMHTYTYKHKLSSGMLFTKRSVVATDSGSSISEEVWFKGISEKTFEKYMGNNYTDVIQIRLQALKDFMEN